MFKIIKLMKPGTRTIRLAQTRCMSKDDKSCRPCPQFECVRKDDGVEDDTPEPTHPFFEDHPPKDFKAYRNIFVFICMPTLIACYINNYYLNHEVPKRPKFKEFSYMRIRTRPFVWDPVKTLFHNPRYNALPDGYEFEVPEEEEEDVDCCCP